MIENDGMYKSRRGKPEGKAALVDSPGNETGPPFPPRRRPFPAWTGRPLRWKEKATEFFVNKNIFKKTRNLTAIWGMDWGAQTNGVRVIHSAFSFFFYFWPPRKGQFLLVGVVSRCGAPETARYWSKYEWPQWNTADLSNMLFLRHQQSK